MSRFSESEIIALKDRNPVDAVAAKWVTLRRKGQTGKYVGPCPLCSQDPHSKTASRFDCDSEKWTCAVCPDGGDVIRLVAKRNGLDDRKDFAKVLELLGGVVAQEDTPATARRAGGLAHRAGKPLDSAPESYGEDLRRAFVDGWRGAARQADANHRYRERERDRLFKNFWQKALPIRGTPVEAYLRLRGLTIARNAQVRYLPECPMFADGTEVEPLMVHIGPAMVCAIAGPDPMASPETLSVGLGVRFAGLHITWLDLGQAKGKAIVRHPHTGLILPSKKSRGSKQGGYINLGGCPPHLATRVICGEGNENTLTGFTALLRAGRDLTYTHFRCAIDLGNLAGKALDRVKHPDLTTETGRPRLVPGVEPDLASTAMPLPAGVRSVAWLCDGDSDAFTTQNAMERARKRHARPDLEQKFLWPGAGRDWNDTVMT